MLPPDFLQYITTLAAVNADTVFVFFFYMTKNHYDKNCFIDILKKIC